MNTFWLLWILRIVIGVGLGIFGLLIHRKWSRYIQRKFSYLAELGILLAFTAFLITISFAIFALLLPGEFNILWYKVFIVVLVPFVLYIINRVKLSKQNYITSNGVEILHLQKFF